MPVSQEDKDRIFKQFYHSMGAPVRSVEIKEQQLETVLEMSIETYSQRVQEFLIENQWSSLLGKNVTTTDMAFALSVKSQDMVTQYTYAYSKQVGLQSNGPWELKKDFIQLEAGRQVYEIQAGREINEVLWFTPTTNIQGLMGNVGGFDNGIGGGYSQVGYGGGSMGNTGGYYIAPAYDILLTSNDINTKNRMLRSELVYKITAGSKGTKLLHLLSTPGSKLGFGGNINNTSGSIGIAGSQVWYFYYETTADNADQCKKDNPDVIKYPNDVPLTKLDFSDFNEPTKIIIRDLFLAESKMTLAKIRGKFSGVIGVAEAERTFDYAMIMTEGVEEKKAALLRLDERLTRLSSVSQLERMAKEAEFLNKSLSYRPLGLYVK